MRRFREEEDRSMRKLTVLGAALALVGFAVQAAPAKGQRDVIEIEVGRHMINDPNKSVMPVSEFWYGREFDVKVTWVEPSEGLLLILSDFRLVSAELEPDPHEGPIWIKDPDFELVLLDGEDEPIREILFSYSEAKPSDEEEGVRITTKTLTLDKTGTRAGNPRHQLVLFKQTLSEVLFEIDPPWVPKPPTG